MKNKPSSAINHSDYALMYGSYACAALGGYMKYDDGLADAFIGACNGMVMGAILITVGLHMIGKPPGFWYRLVRGERLDGPEN